MSRVWPVFGNIALLILIVGGLSYILTQSVSWKDGPEPQALEEVKIDAEEVVANEAVVDEVSSSDSVQEQTIVSEQTRFVTTTSSSQSTQTYLKLTSDSFRQRYLSLSPTLCPVWQRLFVLFKCQG